MENKNSSVKTYKDLIVWQKAMQLVIYIYSLTKQLPQEELYGLTNQMRRAAISIPSNIAEGRFRGTRRDYLQFLRVAYASGAELGTQIELAKRLFKLEEDHRGKTEGLLTEVMKMLNVIIGNLNSKS